MKRFRVVKKLSCQILGNGKMMLVIGKRSRTFTQHRKIVVVDTLQEHHRVGLQRFNMCGKFLGAMVMEHSVPVKFGLWQMRTITKG